MLEESGFEETEREEGLNERGPAMGGVLETIVETEV